jgi:light-harvesting complex 1 beta chain
MAETTTVHSANSLVQDSKTYDALFFMSFVFVLLIAMVAQAMFLKWRPWFPGAESEKSLIKGVRAGVYTFMSHLN